MSFKSLYQTAPALFSDEEAARTNEDRVKKSTVCPHRKISVKEKEKSRIFVGGYQDMQVA
jgi:hypothetical protein